MAGNTEGASLLEDGAVAPGVSLFEAVRCLSTATERVSPIVVEHQRRLSRTHGQEA